MIPKTKGRAQMVQEYPHEVPPRMLLIGLTVKCTCTLLHVFTSFYFSYYHSLIV